MKKLIAVVLTLCVFYVFSFSFSAAAEYGTVEWVIKRFTVCMNHGYEKEMYSPEDFSAEYVKSVGSTQGTIIIDGEKYVCVSVVLKDAKYTEAFLADMSSNEAVKTVIGEKQPIYHVMRGDPDLDGRVTIKDARIALRISLSLENGMRPGTIYFYAADMDESGIVTTEDARSILRKAIGLV